MKEILSEILKKTKHRCDRCNKWFYMNLMISIPIELYNTGNIWRVDRYCKKCYKERLRETKNKT